MRLLPSATKWLAAAALPLTLAACSSTGAAHSASSGTAATASSTQPSAAPTSDPDAGLLTGTQLKAALAPASAFPAGFAVDPSGTRDTGDDYALQTLTDVTAPDCTKLLGTSWSSELTGINGVSFAQSDYINKDSSSEIAQELDVYRGTAAQTMMVALSKISRACPSVVDSQTSTKAKVTEHATTGLGDSAYTITVTDSAWQSGDTLVAARVGTAVVTVLSNEGSDNGAASARKLTREILAALKSKA